MGKRTNGGTRRPGRGPKHAGRAIEAVVRRNVWDKRTSIWRQRCEIANGIVANFFDDWSNVGAWDGLVWGTADTRIILDSISGYVAKQGGPIDATTGELLPVLRRSFVAYQNTHRLNLQALAELARVRREQAKGPSLEQYLARRSANNSPDAPPTPGRAPAAVQSDSPPAAPQPPPTDASYCDHGTGQATASTEPPASPPGAV